MAFKVLDCGEKNAISFPAGYFKVNESEPAEQDREEVAHYYVAMRQRSMHGLAFIRAAKRFFSRRKGRTSLVGG